MSNKPGFFRQLKDTQNYLSTKFLSYYFLQILGNPIKFFNTPYLKCP